MAKRHEEMAREAMGPLYHEDDVANVAALLARAERETLERAASAECYLCRQGAPFRDFEMVPGALWHQNPDNDRILTRCEAERIRALLTEEG